MRLKELREAKGLSQRELARELHVTQGAVQKWEAGRQMPKASRLTAICKVLGCTLDELLKEDEKN